VISSDLVDPYLFGSECVTVTLTRPPPDCAQEIARSFFLHLPEVSKRNAPVSRAAQARTSPAALSGFADAIPTSADRPKVVAVVTATDRAATTVLRMLPPISSNERELNQSRRLSRSLPAVAL
jgi:hypothetical protein